MIAEHISIGYKNNTVFSDINIHLKSGELTCLIGKNGVGKSTLLRSLANLLPLKEGRVLIEGKDMKDIPVKTMSRILAVVFTGKSDLQYTTVRQMVEFGRMPYTNFFGTIREEDSKIVEESLMQVGIPQEMWLRFTYSLSDGEQQKVSIARALAQHTPYIFLDEPTAYLDYPSKVSLLLLLKSLAKNAGKTVFVSTHDIEIALQVADKLVLMSDDVYVGTPQELAEDGCLSRFIDRENISLNKKDFTIRIIE